jgi:hypothetical protein
MHYNETFMPELLVVALLTGTWRSFYDQVTDRILGKRSDECMAQFMVNVK